MGFFDRDVKNGFDRKFDINHDGKLGPGEQAMQFYLSWGDSHFYKWRVETYSSQWRLQSPN